METTTHARESAPGVSLATMRPPIGARVIVHGARLGGSFTPARGGGVHATYRGLWRGYHEFDGRTADRSFVSVESATQVTWTHR